MQIPPDVHTPPEPDAPASVDRASIPRRLRHVTATDRRLLVRSLITMAGRGISKFAIVIFLILATRFLSKAEYGRYSYVLVLANTVGTLADPQISLSAGRDVSAGRRRADRAYWDAFPIVLAAGLAAAVALIGFGVIDPGPGITLLQLLIAGGFVVFNRLFGLGSDMLRSLGRFGVEATIETTGTVLLVAGASIIASSGLGVTAVLGAFLVQGILSTLACNVALRRDIGRPRRPTRTWRPMFRTGLRLSLAASAATLAIRAPLIVLGSSASALVVASYSAALRFADALYLISLTAGQALLPSIASLARTDQQRAARLTRRVATAAFLLGAAIAAATFPFGHVIMTTVFGARYGSAGELMSVFMLAVPFMAVFWISWFALFAYRGEGEVQWVCVGGAGISLVASIAVIPSLGANAAAWIYVGVLAVMAVGAFAALERRARAPAVPDERAAIP